MMALASERLTFFQGLLGTDGLNDRLDAYGPAVAPIWVEGNHLDVCARCIANFVPEFTAALAAWRHSFSETPTVGVSDAGGAPTDDVFRV